MNTHTHTKAVLAGLSALSLLAITACSSASDASVDTDSADASAAEEQTATATGGAVYNFSPEAGLGSSDELHIEIPEELLNVASEEFDEGLMITSVTARAAEDSEAQCAIELTFEYAEDTVELIEDDAIWASGDMHILDGSDAPLVNPRAETYPLEQRMDLIGHPEKIAAPNETGTHVVDTACATAPEATDGAVTVDFRQFNGSEDVEADLEWSADAEPFSIHGFKTLASVTLNVMASGDIHVVGSEISGYEHSGDEHGWISENQTVDSQGNLIDG